MKLSRPRVAALLPGLIASSLLFAAAATLPPAGIAAAATTTIASHRNAVPQVPPSGTHVCARLANSLCWTGHGVGNQVTIETGGYLSVTFPQAGGSQTEFLIKDAAGNCLRANDSGVVYEVADCDSADFHQRWLAGDSSGVWNFSNVSIGGEMLTHFENGGDNVFDAAPLTGDFWHWNLCTQTCS